MNTCPNCGKMAGLHGSVLPGCMCQYSMNVPTPPQRAWVGLTDEEISAVDWKRNETLHEYSRAIEAKLKDKNGG